MTEARESGTEQAPASDLSVAAEVREVSGRPCTVVTLAGRADEAVRDRLRAELRSYTHWGPIIVLIDLSAVPAIDVAPLRELVRVRSLMDGRGGVVGLISPQPDVQEFLEICGVDQLIPVYPSVAAAMTGTEAWFTALPD
ncbi:MAG TPA: STAS domain-containing protein [Streptosporangiaceae bacterium]|jgi:anti-sigma B factor antagonist|nr:STAS domain-containing protein [Streptosporangiaceae bacterium]